MGGHARQLSRTEHAVAGEHEACALVHAHAAVCRHAWRAELLSTDSVHCDVQYGRLRFFFFRAYYRYLSVFFVVLILSFPPGRLAAFLLSATAQPFVLTLHTSNPVIVRCRPSTSAHLCEALHAAFRAAPARDISTTRVGDARVHRWFAERAESRAAFLVADTSACSSAMHFEVSSEWKLAVAKESLCL